MNNEQHKCLYCYLELSEAEQDYHAACSKKIFGTTTPVQLPFDIEEINKLSKNSIHRTNEAMTFQAKFSLDIEKLAAPQMNSYFSIVGLEGHFILRPPVTEFPSLPELEDLTLHLARIAQIKTAEHSLIRLESGELAHLSKRIDRTKKGKIQMEDMCQLSGTLTEDKYQGSIEKIGKVIHAHSSNPGFDVISLLEVTLFSFLTGCGDMHLKNFALLTNKSLDTSLSPVFELVPTQVIFPEGKEEMALAVNGKKKNLKRSDFDSLAEKLKINSKTIENTYKRFEKNLPHMLAFIDSSFLNEELKQQYKDLIKVRAQKIFDLQEAEIEESPEEKLEEIKFEEAVIEEPLIEEPVIQLVKPLKQIAAEPKKKKKANLIDVNTGEIIDKPNDDPFSKQMNLFG